MDKLIVFALVKYDILISIVIENTFVSDHISYLWTRVHGVYGLHGFAAADFVFAIRSHPDENEAFILRVTLGDIAGIYVWPVRSLFLPRSVPAFSLVWIINGYVVSFVGRITFCTISSDVRYYMMNESIFVCYTFFLLSRNKNTRSECDLRDLYCNTARTIATNCILLVARIWYYYSSHSGINNTIDGYNGDISRDIPVPLSVFRCTANILVTY